MKIKEIRKSFATYDGQKALQAEGKLLDCVAILLDKVDALKD